MSITSRGELANSTNADLLISIHCNSHGDRNANGTEVLFELNATEEDQRLASAVLEPLLSALGTVNRGTKRQDLGVLRGAKCPSCLVECAFISNQKEAEILKSDAGQDVIAEAIAKGIANYLGIEKEPEKTARLFVNGEEVTSYEMKFIDGKNYIHIRFAQELGYYVNFDAITWDVHLLERK